MTFELLVVVLVWAVLGLMVMVIFDVIVLLDFGGRTNGTMLSRQNMKDLAGNVTHSLISKSNSRTFLEFEWLVQGPSCFSSNRHLV